MSKAVIGIDVGGTTTKIVGFRSLENGAEELIAPQFVRATDPLTSVYGAFGKFTAENGLGLSDISQVLMTGAGAGHLRGPIYDLDCRPVPEFSSIGIGGLYLSGLDEAIVVSMGTGTALIHAKKENGGCQIEYLGGTGVGGGTLVGLSRKLLGVDNIDHIEQLCSEGDLANIDLRIKDLSHAHTYQGINENLTASNFGNVSDLASSGDLALGIANMVAETIAMLSIFAARSYKLQNIVLTGNLTTISSIRSVFENLSDSFGVRFIIPENSQFGTVIGAALSKNTVG
ncbi:MAG: pantothenate kinase [Clostridia bacterium]|nr:pantothenate kinase [Clostridia bacterium]MBR2927465.1 pantothenate kinase [Clostridia bacterium]